MFSFQQFDIDDRHCAMKVGTDAVLLGAWADVEGCRRILDVGCGSGVVTLMAAQRAVRATVTGVEIDEAAAADAQANARRSPFAERVDIVCADILKLAVPAEDECFEKEENAKKTGRFDCILSNPPYHEEDLLPPLASRAAARHTSGGGLTFEALLRAVSRLLASSPSPECAEGTAEPRFCVILPAAAAKRFTTLAAVHGLWAERRTEVVTRLGKQPKRILLRFSRRHGACEEDTLELLRSDGKRSLAYDRLCRDFYLHPDNEI
ncbi:MAG: tRNA1(Val) (adenine(37)-N6)-methyltransferase [Alloprevotella sp.]